MAITMMQILTGLTGLVGCLVCMSLIRIVIGLAASITGMGVTQQTNLLCTNETNGNSVRIESMVLLIILCTHLTINTLFGRKTAGNLNYSLTADIIDWTFNLTEYCLAIHLLGFFKKLTKCIDSNTNTNIDQFVYDPNVVWDLFVAWIAFDTILFLFRMLISYILYRKWKQRGHQRKYVLQ